MPKYEYFQLLARWFSLCSILNSSPPVSVDYNQYKSPCDSLPDAGIMTIQCLDDELADHGLARFPSCLPVSAVDAITNYFKDVWSRESLQAVTIDMCTQKDQQPKVRKALHPILKFMDTSWTQFVKHLRQVPFNPNIAGVYCMCLAADVHMTIYLRGGEVWTTRAFVPSVSTILLTPIARDVYLEVGTPGVIQKCLDYKEVPSHVIPFVLLTENDIAMAEKFETGTAEEKDMITCVVQADEQGPGHKKHTDAPSTSQGEPSPPPQVDYNPLWFQTLTVDEKHLSQDILPHRTPWGLLYFQCRNCKDVYMSTLQSLFHHCSKKRKMPVCFCGFCGSRCPDLERMWLHVVASHSLQHTPHLSSVDTAAVENLPPGSDSDSVSTDNDDSSDHEHGHGTDDAHGLYSDSTELWSDADTVDYDFEPAPTASPSPETTINFNTFIDIATYVQHTDFQNLDHLLERCNDLKFHSCIRCNGQFHTKYRSKHHICTEEKIVCKYYCFECSHICFSKLDLLQHCDATGHLEPSKLEKKQLCFFCNQALYTAVEKVEHQRRCSRRKRSPPQTRIVSHSPEGRKTRSQSRKKPEPRMSCRYCTGLFKTIREKQDHEASCVQRQKLRILKQLHHLPSRTIVVAEKTFGIRAPLPHKCSQCVKKFRTIAARNRHTARIHGLFKCKQADCDKEYSSRTSLSRHEKIHTGFKHACVICFKLYQYPSTLRAHLWSHIKKSFQCTRCSKRYTYHNDMLMHRKLHSPHAEEYPCDKCDMVFKERRRLTEHYDKHIPPRHQCKECGVRFKYRKSLSRHRPRCDGK